MCIFGFDFDGGCFDISVYLFCGGVFQDVCIIICYNENDLFSVLFGVIYEIGYVCYEQNLFCLWVDQFVGFVCFIVIYELQSLFFEMQLGCSEWFFNCLLLVVCEWFGDWLVFSQDNFVVWNQQVKFGFICVDVDEVSYLVYVILCYEIECVLIDGEIEVDDILLLWDEKMQYWLGLLIIGNYWDGCMQDIYWIDGGFGYFFFYILGVMYVVQLMVVVCCVLLILDCDIEEGDFSVLFDWLWQNIWQYGSCFIILQLIQQVIGEDFNSCYFCEYLIICYL